MTLRLSKELALPAEAVTETFAFLAKRGAGKTYAASVLVEELLEAKLQVVVVDPMGAWYGLRSSADGKGAGFPIAVLGGDHGDVPLEAAAGAVVADLVVDDRLSCVIDVSAFSKGDRKRFVVDFAERLYRRNRDPLMLVLEEADLFAPQRPQRGEERLLGAIEDLVRRGRGRGIGITLITQRSAVLNKDVLTQTECLVALRTTSPHDRKAIEAWIDVHGLKEERELVMSTLPSLPVGTAWLWSPGWLETLKRIRIRPRKTFDSSATPKAGAKRAAPKTVADVDLDALRERMAETIEKAAAEDPRALKAKIAELRTEIQRLGRDLERRTPERVEIPYAVPTIPPDVVHFAKQASDSIASLLAFVDQHVDEAPARSPATARPGATRQTPHRPAASPVAPAAASHRAPGGASSNGDGWLPKGERLVLTAIAQHVDGATRELVTLLTGYKRSSRDTYIQRLRERGYVAPRLDGRIAATGDGVSALGPDFEPRPTGPALRDFWMQRLPAGERAIFKIVVNQYPLVVGREELSVRSGYKRSSRDTYIQRLRTRELIETLSDGVRASAGLFEAAG